MSRAPSPGVGRGGFCILFAFCLFLTATTAQTVTAAVTPSQTASVTPSIASSPSPSPSPASPPFSTVKDVLVLDCNAGLHILPGHPLEVNVNLRGLQMAMNLFAQEITAHARSAAASTPNDASCSQALTDEMIERHFIPSFPMLLNNLEPLRKRRTLPPACQTHVAGVNDNKPVFPRTFWDDSAISTVFSAILNMPSLRIPQYWLPPYTCTYDRYVNGDGGCALDLNEPITNTDFKLGVHTCPNSYMPYVSLTCQGPMCGSFMLPCASHFEQTPSIGPDECSYAQTGLVCRAVSGDGDYGDDLSYTEFAKMLQVLGLSGSLNELANCDPNSKGSATSGAAFKFNQLRAKMYAMFNLTVPSSTGNVHSFSFCMPPADTWTDLKTRAVANWNEYYEEDTAPTPYSASVCTSFGCNPYSVGDGTCNMECYHAACYFDGGDCGGAVVDKGNYAAITAVAVDQSIPTSCLLKPSALKDTDFSPDLSKNLWEACGGAAFGYCTTMRHLTGIQEHTEIWDPPILLSGISVFDFDRMTGINFTTPSAAFEPPSSLSPLFRSLVQTTCAGEIGVTAMNGFLQAGLHAPWMQDALAFFADWTYDLVNCRASSRSAPAPPATPLPTLAPYQVETRFMMHHPAFWAYQRFYLGNSGFSNNKNQPWNTDPTNPQGNFVPNCGSGSNLPTLNKGQTCFYNTLWDRTRDPTKLIFGDYSFVDPLSTYGFLREPNPLSVIPSPTANANPNVDFGRLYYDQWSRNFRTFAPSDNVQSQNMNDFSGSCNWDSMAGYGGGQWGTNLRERVCRISNRAFSTLFADRAANPLTFNLHFDLQIDANGQVQNAFCAGAATGQVNPAWGPTPSLLPGASPYPTATLNPSPSSSPGAPNMPNAGLALPPAALYIESTFALFFSNPVPCNADTDCGSTLGTKLYCVDLDNQFANLKGMFTGRNVDPIGYFTSGRYNVDKSTPGTTPGSMNYGSSGTYALSLSIREILIGLSGSPREVPVFGKTFAKVFPNIPAADQTRPLLFCFPNVNVWTANQPDGTTGSSWINNNYEAGTCDTTKAFNDPSRLCMMATPTATTTSPPAPFPAWQGGALPMANLPSFGYYPLNGQGQPAAYNIPFIYPGLTPPKTSSGVMPVVASSRSGQSYPGAGTYPKTGFTTPYTVSLPAMTAGPNSRGLNWFNNNMKERVRWALAMGFSQFGLKVEPNLILITSVSDNPGAFQPLLDGSRAGVQVNFNLDLPDASLSSNYTYQLGGQPNTNTFAGQIGAVLASYGIVPYRYQSQVTVSPTPPTGSAPANVAGAVVGALFGIGIFAAMVWYYVYGTIFGVAVPAVCGWHSKEEKKANPNRKVGEVVAGAGGGPPRKSSTVESTNPMAGRPLVGVLKAPAGAAKALASSSAPGSQVAVVVGAAAAASATAAEAPAAATEGTLPPTLATGVTVVANPFAQLAAASAAEAPAAAPAAAEPASFPPVPVHPAAAAEPAAEAVVVAAPAPAEAEAPAPAPVPVPEATPAKAHPPADAEPETPVSPSAPETPAAAAAAALETPAESPVSESPAATPAAAADATVPDAVAAVPPPAPAE